MNERCSTESLSLELKYCERCGGLWLRPVGGQQAYCAGCARTMAEFPSASWEDEGTGGVEGGGEENRYANDRGGRVDTVGGAA